MHIIAAKAVAFGEALSDDFKQYAKQIKRNEKFFLMNCSVSESVLFPAVRILMYS